MGILFGLLAAICFGLADFMVTLSTRRVGVLQALFSIQLFGVLLVGVVLLLARQGPPASLAAWGLMAGISVINFVGTLLLYRSFSIGTLSIVSPIASGFAVVTAVLSILLLGERPPILTLVGTVLLIAGVVVVSRAQGTAGNVTLAGIPEALGTAVCFGIYFWALNRLTPTLGVLWPVWITRVVQLLCALIVLRARGPIKLGWTRQTVQFLVVAAVFDSAALLSFNLGVGQTFTTIATALTSLYSTVAILLAWIFLRERLSLGQWSGVGVILTGVLLVSV